MHGRLITLEGVEGAGKSTQLARLLPWLQAAGYTVQTTREPGGTALGQEIRALLLHGEAVSPVAELLLYAADRAHHVATLLRPALAVGTWVICDRYTDSTLAYQGYGRGLDLDLVAQTCAMATQGLTPDLTLWLDLDAAAGLQRLQGRPGQADRLERASLEFHQRVQQGFAALAQADPQRIVRLDASLSPDAVQAEIRQVLRQRLGVTDG